MKLKKPKFWDYNKPNLLSNFLYPISKIIEILTIFKFKKKVKIENVKTICIGNIYLGGTGKTSLAIKLKELFDKHNINSCFIKKDYSDQIDEQKLLSKFGEVFVNKSRIKALKKAASANYKVAIFDDGLQDKSIKYDLSFVCFNKTNLIGNGRMIPAGPLREGLDNIKIYKNIFLIGNNENTQTFKDQINNKYGSLKFFDCRYIFKNLNNFNDKEKYVVFSGIGNFGTLKDMLKQTKMNLVEFLEFPDHYNFSENDIGKIFKIAEEKKAKVITTEKDFLRLDEKIQKKIGCIKIEIEIKQIEELKKILSF
tara:strand:+ start:2914 stop:3843 length:930 start_codon:yes stop_codon:yes gene_type:complete